LFLKVLKSLLFSCLIAISAFGQDPIDIEFVNRLNVIKSNDVSWGDYQGSPYLEKNYSPAKISATDNIYSVKYNAYTDKMEVILNGVVKALHPRSNYTVEFINKNKVYKVFSNNKGEKGYFVVLFEGEKSMLLVKETINFYKEVKPKSGYDEYEPPQFKREKDRFYMGLKDATSILLSNKKKDFYATFGEFSEEIKKFVKSEKLNLKDPADLITIFNYYDQL
jgi:hypothetical protein